MNVLLHPTYFPSISHFVALSRAESVTYEMEDNFQKQTNRNRTYIYSPNGIQVLNIPVKHGIHRHQKTKDVRLETTGNWQKQHFKSLEAAYRGSPFFEYFEDAIQPIFNKKYTFLLDLNFETIAIISKCLQYENVFDLTKEYFSEFALGKDYRSLANGKKDASIFETYTQVFEEKYGFLNNISVLDLLFNEGRFALDYLKTQKL